MTNLISLLVLPFLLAFPASPAMAGVFPLWPDTQVVGEIRHVRARDDETLRDIAARYDVGLNEVVRVNIGVDPWRPEPGTWITLPTQHVLPDVPRDGLVINVAESRVYYYVRSILGRGAEVLTFPAVLAERDWGAMLGETRIEAKLRDAASSVPVKYDRAGGAPPDTATPADDRALRLGVAGCLVQSLPAGRESTPRAVSGCVRLSPNALRMLFEEVGEDTPVRIVDQPYKVGWRDGALYLESHASRRGGAPGSVTPAVRAIIQATTERRAPIDWETVRRVAEEASGVPVRVSR